MLQSIEFRCHYHSYRFSLFWVFYLSLKSISFLLQFISQYYLVNAHRAISLWWFLFWWRDDAKRQQWLSAVGACFDHFLGHGYLYYRFSKVKLPLVFECFWNCFLTYLWFPIVFGFCILFVCAFRYLYCKMRVLSMNINNNKKIPEAHNFPKI